MSTFYVIALCGVSVILLGVMFDAMARVSRKPEWNVPQYAAPLAAEERPALAEAPVGEVEVRHSGFVGLTNNEDFRLTA